RPASPARIDEPPDVGVERPELPLHLQKRPGVAHGRLDLPPVPHNPRIGQEPLDLPGPVPRHTRRAEAVERLPVALSLPQDRLPRKPRLRPFQYQKLEEPPVVVHRHAPLLVVVTDRQLALGPGASLHAAGVYRVPAARAASAPGPPEP